MRTTVGPLPAAVYWRRRAVVLGALLLGVIVLFVSCSGGDDDSTRGKGASSQAPISAPASRTPDDEPSFVDPPAGAGNPSLPDPEDIRSAGTDGQPVTQPDDGVDDGTDAGTDTNVTVPVDGSCTDAEISVTPIPASTTARRGVPVEIRLKIKNVSARTCSRDVGADLQELYIESGAQKIWSSDTCSNAKGSDVRQIPPNGEREYNVTWNGRQSNKCSAGLAAGTAPPAGQYQVRARLGAKVSVPVTLTLTA
ncbi:adhesin [Actinoplanes sp. NPDC049681]|uniref:adhesin n=1 Tax=Actinoplanes sp. NPDC049681 TaxID=3363905 RepID=UPI00378DF1BC